MASIARAELVTVYGVNLSQLAPGQEDPPGFAFRALNADDFGRGALFQEKNRAPVFRRMLLDGHRGYGYVTPQGEAISYLWLSSPRFGTAVVPFELGLSCRIGADSGYIWDCRTHGDYRKRGLYRCGLKHMQALCREAGLKSATIVSEVRNHPSQAAILAAGFTAGYNIAILRLFGRLYVISAGGRIFIRGRYGVVDL